ncbi:MAG: hypothetical protein ABIL18_07055 [candidate division WOR-3 bacterium]
MAIIVDEEVAKIGACHGYSDPKTGEKYLWMAGAIGMLSDEQEKTYCKTIRLNGERVPRRIQEFKEAVKEAHKEIENIPKGQRLTAWLEAMSKALRKRGIEV